MYITDECIRKFPFAELILHQLVIYSCHCHIVNEEISSFLVRKRERKILTSVVFFVKDILLCVLFSLCTLT